MRLYTLLVIFYFLSIIKSPVDGQFEIVDPQPGEVFVTPRLDLDLQPVSLQVLIGLQKRAERPPYFFAARFVVKVCCR